MIYQLYSIYQNTGRPDRFISEHASLEEALDAQYEQASNELDENNYRVAEVGPNQSATYQDERGFVYFSDDIILH